jgi:uncharacterized membrane protein YagU involved in acid resistance
MSKIAPMNLSNIIVKPTPDNSFSDVGLSSLAPPKPNVRVLGIPVNKRETHVNRSDSFQSKLIRFIRADEYKTYDTVWSKVLIVTGALTGIMTILFIVFVLINYGATNMYVSDSLLTEEFIEKNSDFNTLNVVSKANAYIGGCLASISFAATCAQFYYVYKHNDFRR